MEYFWNEELWENVSITTSPQIFEPGKLICQGRANLFVCLFSKGQELNLYKYKNIHDSQYNLCRSFLIRKYQENHIMFLIFPDGKASLARKFQIFEPGKSRQLLDCLT